MRCRPHFTDYSLVELVFCLVFSLPTKVQSFSLVTVNFAEEKDRSAHHQSGLLVEKIQHHWHHWNNTNYQFDFGAFFSLSHMYGTNFCTQQCKLLATIFSEFSLNGTDDVAVLLCDISSVWVFSCDPINFEVN